MKTLLCVGSLAALLACAACNGATPRDEPGMVHVPAGKFKMGYDKGRANEKPEREVEIASGFYIGKHEVTNEEYAKFIAATKRAAPANWPDGKFKAGEEKFPVTMVTWDDASNYCQWAGGRLPTEAEWEYAARGTDGRLYPWGNEFKPGMANNYAAGKSGPVAAGSFPECKGPFGTFDQAGNVWEWTSTAGAGPNQMVIKGGSYAILEDPPRASLRGVLTKDQAKENLGFRLAKDE